MDSEIPSCRDQVVTFPTVTEWINELMKTGRNENEKRYKEFASGRKEDRPEPTEYVKARAYLMELYDKAKVEEIKYSRYTTPPPHLVGKVSLITCDSAFLPPRSSATGAGKEDLQKAMHRVGQNREGAKSGEEGESSREHLVPKSMRIKAEDGFIQRKDLMQGMKALIGLKVRAILRRRPCTERRPPRRDGSGAVTVRLAVRVERSATSKEAVGTRHTRAVELREFCRQQGAERGPPHGGGSGAVTE